jgi:hypothetical protein
LQEVAALGPGGLDDARSGLADLADEGVVVKELDQHPDTRVQFAEGADERGTGR